jgi:hypothetical protein
MISRLIVRSISAVCVTTFVTGMRESASGSPAVRFAD